MVTLDGVVRSLNSNMLVIADAKRAVALAGVMGGSDSEVTEKTVNILLESANFNPANIHFTGHQLKMTSEAGIRFERGINPELTVYALRRATQLMVHYAGGQAANGILDIYPGKVEKMPIILSSAQVRSLLGKDFNREEISGVLESLGFECKNTGTDAVAVTTPYWRSDIN